MMKHYNLGLEMVAFQDPAFFKALTHHYTELKKLTKEELRNQVTLQAISNEIKQFTNLTVNVNSANYPPCVMTPDVNKNNVLIINANRQYLKNRSGMKFINEADGVLGGTVNWQEGKVYGAFANIPHQLEMGVDYIKSDVFTPEELAAITLHEIGHLFTYYEYITRTVTTNQVLAGVTRELTNSNDPKVIEATLLSAKKALRLSDLDVKELMKSDNTKIMELVIVSNAVQQTRSELGSDIYDMTTWEALADNYASRHQAGRYLVSALDKLQRDHSASYRSTPVFLFLEAAKLTTLIGGILMTLMATPAMAVVGKLSLVAFVAMVAMDMNHPQYDRPGARTKRIRDQIVENLKRKNITKQQREQLNEDLVFIDDTLSTINDRRQLFSIIGGWFIPSIRNRYNQEKIQQELESLIANDLFTIFEPQAEK